MRYSHTAVIERGASVDGDLATEPYEAGWAAEARWFVKVGAFDGPTVLAMQTEISPDGLVWIPLEEAVHTVSHAGMVSWSVRDFGQWLRLRLSTDEGETSPTVMVYLALKS